MIKNEENPFRLKFHQLKNTYIALLTKFIEIEEEAENYEEAYKKAILEINANYVVH